MSLSRMRANRNRILRRIRTHEIFHNNPLERLMMQKPKAAREDSPPDAAKEHFCYGCKRFGQSCVRPCYRDVKRMEAAPCAL